MLSVQKYALLFIQLCCFLSLSACSEPEAPKVKIAINPWPGYEFVYLAQEKGFFQEQKLDIELIELPSLADVQRVYVQGRADGMASTMIETVQATGLTQSSSTVILIPDYSNGGDVIVSSKQVTSFSELKGKRIGAEIGSLGMYILAQALDKQGMSLSDVEIINVEQLEAETSLLNGTIDAVVSYPPYSTSILKHEQFHQVFDTSEIPNDIIDVISIRTEVLETLPNDWLVRFHKAWDKALTYSEANKDEAYGIMAGREGISKEDFADALTGLQLLDSRESIKAIQADQTAKNVVKVCTTLEHANTINFDCNKTMPMIKFAQFK